MMKGKFTILLALTLLVLLGSESRASMYFGEDPGFEEFVTRGFAWDPGVNTVRTGGDPAPGAATWSVMGVGIGDSGLGAYGGDPHSGTDLTTDLMLSYAGGAIDAITAIGMGLDQWAAVSLFSNLGQVADDGFLRGSSATTSGDIRVGALGFDGSGGTLAHGFYPGTVGGGNVVGTSYGGDVHMDNGEAWSDGGGAGTFDYYTVMLHELGHSLGLMHSSDTTSVMYAYYSGMRRTLKADDIAGIQDIYGVVPVPGAFLLGVLGLSVVGVKLRKYA